MKINEKLVRRMVQYVFHALKEKNVVTFKAKEDAVMEHAASVILNEFQKENTLDSDVYKMMDQLERDNPESFERHKMFPLLKRRLAKERGIIL